MRENEAVNRMKMNECKCMLINKGTVKETVDEKCLENGRQVQSYKNDS